MKQSTLIGAFTVTNRISAKTEVLPMDVDISNKDDNTTTDKEKQIAVEAALIHDISSSKKAQEHDLSHGKEYKSHSVDQPSAEKKPRDSSKKKVKHKLSLSSKRSEAANLSKPVPEKETSTCETVTKNTEAVPYSVFLAQVAMETKPKDPAVEQVVPKTKKAKQAEGEDGKPAMSYSDFLSMFKPAPTAAALTVNDSSDVLQVEDRSSIEVPEAAPAVQCKTITSFFSKSGPSQREKKRRGSGPMTVIAEVHQRNGSSKCKLPGSPLKLEGRKEVKSLSDPDAIEFLGSEMLADTDGTVENTSPKSKRRKVETEDKKNQMTTGEDKEKKGVIILLPNEKTEAKDDEKCLSQALPNPASSTAKTSQSQLCFGKGGLVLQSKPKVDCDTESPLAVEDSAVKKRKRGRPPKVSHHVKDDKEGDDDVDKQKSFQTSESETPAGSKADKAKNEVEASEKPEVEESSSDTPTLRRSSRVSRPVRPIVEADVVEIEDDDRNDDRDCCGKEGQRGRGRRPQRQAVSDTEPAKGNPAKKPKGPLAPIFTAMKLKEEVRPPPEDPEKVRLRKEFMMSGIPEELKKQIALSLPAAMLDHPPFPKPSHVQQLSDGECCAVSFTTVALKECWGVDGEALEKRLREWKNLDLGRSIQPDAKLKSFEFLKQHAALSEVQVKAWLAKWQQADAKFPFQRMYTQLSLPLRKSLDSAISGETTTSAKHKSTPIAKNKKKSLCIDEIESDVDVVIIDEALPVVERASENTASVDPSSCLWPDLHQPVSSKDIVGNAAVLDQLRDWLLEWKKIVQKEVRKASKRSVQSSKGRGKGGWSSDSDFTDSEEEDERLCNTMLLTGPHGVGKTAAVYALAQEMEYKVFEVNSSTLRSGKQILSQLEEATQSHRVAPSKTRPPASLNSSFTQTLPAGKLRLKQEDGPASKKSSKAKSMASAFANLFQTPAQKSAAKSKEQEKGKKAAKAGDEKGCSVLSVVKKKFDSESSKKSMKTCKAATRTESKSGEEAKPSTGSQNLATTSLILFDEVDIVFEEDKGFLATVQHFMSSTKIPIVLTASAPAFSLQLQARHDHIQLRRPPVMSSASFLHCLCLAHGVVTPQAAIERLLQLTGGDMRKCLLHLQFWCQSGGGRVLGPTSAVTVEALSSCRDTVMIKDDEASSCEHTVAAVKDEGSFAGSMAAGSDDSVDGMFLSLRQRPRKARRMVLKDDDDEESSNSSCQSLSQRDRQSAHPEVVTEERSSAKRRKLSTRRTATAKTAPTASRSACESAPKILPSRASAVASPDDAATTGCQDQDPGPHQDLVESFLGLEDVRLSAQAISAIIQAPNLSGAELDKALHVVDVADRALHCNTIYSLALFSSSLPACSRPQIRLTLSSARPAPQQKKRRRILNASWLDSDCSDEEKQTEKKVVEANTDGLKEEGNVVEANKDGLKETENGVEANTDELGETEEGRENGREVSLAHDAKHSACAGVKLEDGGKQSNEHPNSKPGVLSQECKVDKGHQSSGFQGSEMNGEVTRKNRVCRATLSELSRFYESVSMMDIHAALLNKRGGEEEMLSPGMSDEDASFGAATLSCASILTAELGGAVSLLAARALCQGLGVCSSSWRDEEPLQEPELPDWTETSVRRSWPDELHLPVGVHMPDIWALSGEEQQKRPFHSATKNVVSCLGSTVLTSNPAVHTDTLPYLREICRSESARHLAKAQRRFHHYLDNAGLALKKSTIACLTATFTET